MKKFIYMLMPLALLAATSCENDPKFFDDSPSLWLSGDAAQKATADSVLYSFRMYDFAIQSYDLHLVASLAGYATNSDREFNLEVVEEKTNVASSDYVIGNPILPKDSYKAIVPITVKRTVAGLDLTKEAAKLTLRIVRNDNFEVGAEENSEYSLMWCDYLIEPESWGNISWYMGPFSQARYKFIIDFTGYTDFEEFNGNYNMVLWLQATCIRLLNEYNADPANAGRPEGWPYLNDNGQPLEFGENLPY